MHIHPFFFYMHISPHSRYCMKSIFQMHHCVSQHKVAENKDVLKIRILKKSTKGKMRLEELKTL